MSNSLKNTADGICAGILISAGGGVYLACDDRVVGACFFSVALVCICMMGYNLYTGKICYLPDNPRTDYMGLLLTGLAGNTAATLVCGLALSYAVPSMRTAAEVLCEGKLSGQTFLQTLIRGIFCGFLVYLSVEIYRRKNTPAGILLCIPTFILSGYEHSIADMFYFGAARCFNGPALLFILTVILGNSLGGILLPLLGRVPGRGGETRR